MTPSGAEPPDPRDIPVLTDAVDGSRRPAPPFDAKAAHAAIVTETLGLADSLLHEAAKNMEAILFERVFDRLREQLPELVDRVLREHTVLAKNPEPGDQGPARHD